MASIRDLRTRIKSVGSIKQITRAMEMVAATKLRRFQGRAITSRPYAQEIVGMLERLAGTMGERLAEHPLFRRGGADKPTGVVLVTSDRGLCGSFNTNILKTAVAFLREREGRALELQAVGRKGRDFFRRRPWAIRREWADVLRNVEFSLAAEIGQEVVARYAAGEVDAVVLDVPVIVNYIKNNPAAGIKLTGHPITEEQYAIAVNPARPAIVTMLNTALATIHANGEYDAIFQRWFGAP